MRYVAVFLAMALFDGLWTLYTLWVTQRYAWWAASSSALIVVISAFLTLSYLKDRRYVIPAALGAFVGTYLSVRVW